MQITSSSVALLSAMAEQEEEKLMSVTELMVRIELLREEKQELEKVSAARPRWRSSSSRLPFPSVAACPRTADG